MDFVAKGGEFYVKVRMDLKCKTDGRGQANTSVCNHRDRSSLLRKEMLGIELENERARPEYRVTFGVVIKCCAGI